MYLRNTFFLILVIVLPFSGVCGNESIGTLETRFNTSRIDTVKIELLLKMGDYFEHTDYDSALKFYNQALELSRNQNRENIGTTHLKKLKELEIKSLRYIAFLNKSWRFYVDAIDNYSQLLNIYVRNDFSLGVTRSLTSLGNIHYYQSDLAKALNFYLQALEVATEYEFIKQIADLNSNIASIHFLRGDYIRSLEHYQQALKFYDEVSDDRNKGIVYLGIGNIHNSMGNFNISKENYEISLKYFDELKDHLNIASIYLSLGTLLFSNNDMDEAEAYYRKALYHATTGNDSRQEAQSLLNIGILHAATGNITDALENYEKVLNITQNTSLKHIESSTLRHKAILLFRQKNYPLAFAVASQSLEIAKEIESLDDQLETYRVLAQIRENQGEFNQALQLYRQYKLLNDSLLGIEKQRQLNEMDAVFQSEKKHQTIEMQKLELDKNQAELKRKNQQVNTIILVLVFVIILAISIIIFYTNKKIKDQEITRLRQIISNNEKRMDELRLDMDHQNLKIEKLEHINRKGQKKLSQHLNLARSLLNTTSGHDQQLNDIFPGKSFTFPNMISGGPSDLCYIRKDLEKIIMVFADMPLGKLDKTMLNLAMNAFLDQIVQAHKTTKPVKLLDQVHTFLSQIIKNQFPELIDPGISMGLLCINLKDEKIKFVSENMLLFIAIARNPQSIFSPLYEYHEIQRLEPGNGKTQSDHALQVTNDVDFKLKESDRIYIINTGTNKTSPFNPVLKEAMEADLLHFIDTHQNMEIDMQGQYLERELKKRLLKQPNGIPDNLTIRGLQL